MKLNELKEGDVLIVSGRPYNRTEWFTSTRPNGDQYYRVEGNGGFLSFNGDEAIEHFSDNVYILETT